MSDTNEVDLSSQVLVDIDVTPSIVTSARVMTRLQCQCHQSIADGETVKVRNKTIPHSRPFLWLSLKPVSVFSSRKDNGTQPNVVKTKVL